MSTQKRPNVINTRAVFEQFTCSPEGNGLDKTAAAVIAASQVIAEQMATLNTTLEQYLETTNPKQ